MTTAKCRQSFSVWAWLGAAWLGVALSGCGSARELLRESGPDARAAATFVSGPTAEATDDGRVRIEFEVGAPTDVAVWVRDADGRTVRHLAAGALGPNAPAPLVPNTLRQALVWDGTDDAGRPAGPGRYRIEVGLGLTAQFDGILGHDPQMIGDVHGLATGPTGDVYVMSAIGRDSQDPRIQVFTAQGEYARTMVPRPGGLPDARVAPFNELTRADGHRVPREMLPHYGGRGRQIPIVLPDGDLVFVTRDIQGKVLANRFVHLHRREYMGDKPVPHRRRLLRLAADGGAPMAADYAGPWLAESMSGSLCLAASPDARVLYVSSGADHAVYATSWAPDAPMRPILGTPGQAGVGATGLNNPMGIDTDAQGAIYVADRDNHRVAVFAADGRFLGEIKIEWPQQALVDRRTGAIYVVAGSDTGRRGGNWTVNRYDRLDADKPSAVLSLHAYWLTVALDRSNEKQTVLYAANIRKPGGSREAADVVKLVDDGAALRQAAVLIDGREPFQPLVAGVDRRRELVYAKTGIWGNYVQIDGRTGAMRPFALPMHAKANGVHELIVGADGPVIGHVHQEFGRLDETLSPVPFSGTGSYLSHYPRENVFRSYYAKGGTVAPDGGVYWLHERTESGGQADNAMVCSALGADGKERKSPLIEFEDGSAAGIRVDRAGNIYTLNHLKPVGRLVPEEIADQTAPVRQDRHVYSYGSVLKFGPQGGAVRLVGEGPVKARAVPAGRFQLTTVEGRGDFETEGVEWVWFGVSSILTSHRRDGCHCWAPRFDLDDFDRLFLPDQMLNRVHVLDSAGNHLGSIGRYGNADQGGGDFLPLANPRTVGVSGTALYVGDMSNNGVVRARLGYRNVATATVALGGVPPSLPVAVRSVRQALEQTAPNAAQTVNWRELADRLPRQADENDARFALATAGRAANLSADDAARIMNWLANNASDRMTAASVHVGWGRREPEIAAVWSALLDHASPLVRVAAADALLAVENPTGQAAILGELLAEDPLVHRLAENVFLLKIREDDGSRFPIGKAEVTALTALLARTNTIQEEQKRGSHWYMRGAAIVMLTDSGLSEAAQPLLDAMASDIRVGRTGGRNINRCIEGLGRLRARTAVPALIERAREGRIGDGYRLHGYQGETLACSALADIGDPVAVAPLIELIETGAGDVPAAALRALSRLFADPPLDSGFALFPVEDRLEAMPENLLQSAPAEQRAAWNGFWERNADRYPWNETASVLRRKEPEQKRRRVQ